MITNISDANILTPPLVSDAWESSVNFRAIFRNYIQFQSRVASRESFEFRYLRFQPVNCNPHDEGTLLGYDFKDGILSCNDLFYCLEN